jgi:hypothetical protein
MVHIADAPCHGTEFGNCHDHFPNGDKKGRSISSLMRGLLEVAAIQVRWIGGSAMNAVALRLRRRGWWWCR